MEYWQSHCLKYRNWVKTTTEQADLIAQEPERVNKLTALLNAHIVQQADPIWPALLDALVYTDKHLNEEHTTEDEFIYWPN